MAVERIWGDTLNLWRFALLLLAAGSATAGAKTSPHDIVAHGRDLFRLPPGTHYGDSCDGRRINLKDPDFGEGLTARYIYRRGKSRADDLPNEKALHPDDQRMTWYLGRRGILEAPSFVRPDGPGAADAYATEQFVIRTHDDMTKHFTIFCSEPLGFGYFLSDVEYTPATEGERALKSRQTDFAPGVEPLAAGRYRDIMPKGATVTTFTLPFAFFSARGKLELAVRSGAGAGTIYEYEGSRIRSDDYRIRKLTENGYLVLYLDFDGRVETVIIDTRPATSAAELNARAEPVMALEQNGPDGLYLKRIAQFPSRGAAIADLRLPQSVRDDLGRQVTREADRYYGSDQDRARRMPDGIELKAVLVAGWDTPSEIGEDHWQGFSDAFHGRESTLGEIHDYACTRTGGVFSCMIGVTFLQDGKPKYNQSRLEFKRDPANNFALKHYDPPIIVT